LHTSVAPARAAALHPRQSRPSARTLPRRLGKAVQPFVAGHAVNAIPGPRAEPQCSTPFTDFQFYMQILHFVFSGPLSLPASLRFFSGRRGSLRSMRTPSRWPGTLVVPRRAAGACCFFGHTASNLGKEPAALLLSAFHTSGWFPPGSFPMWDGRSVVSYSLRQ
jgi:hypothetical protein